jgi:hypothetical protein
MPGRNGMGPMGQGPMTGGGRGWCGGAAQQMDLPQRGPGFRMGLAAGFPTGLSKDQELAALKWQAQSLEQALGNMKSRIQELDKPTADTGPTTEK